MHRQQEAPQLSNGEYPICAAMTSGYVFRIENQAMVHYLQKVGKTAHLTTLSISGRQHLQEKPPPNVSYIVATTLTLATIPILLSMNDGWGVFVIGTLLLVRLINVLVLRRRAQQGWKGQPEPDQKSDLMVLMNNDRWIRVRGQVDDVKAVTSGEWLRDMTLKESTAISFAALLTYLTAALSINMTVHGQVVFVLLLFGSAGLLGYVNECTNTLEMYGRLVSVSGEQKAYERRLDLADELILETGRKDWAVRLGMIKADHEILDKSTQMKDQQIIL